jgi:hypothetical protein
MKASEDSDTEPKRRGPAYKTRDHEPPDPEHFKGVWISKALLRQRGLSWMEKVLAAEIDDVRRRAQK